MSRSLLAQGADDTTGHCCRQGRQSLGIPAPRGGLASLVRSGIRTRVSRFTVSCLTTWRFAISRPDAERARVAERAKGTRRATGAPPDDVRRESGDDWISWEIDRWFGLLAFGGISRRWVWPELSGGADTFFGGRPVLNVPALKCASSGMCLPDVGRKTCRPENERASHRRTGARLAGARGARLVRSPHRSRPGRVTAAPGDRDRVVG